MLRQGIARGTSPPYQSHWVRFMMYVHKYYTPRNVRSNPVVCKYIILRDRPFDVADIITAIARGLV